MKRPDFKIGDMVIGVKNRKSFTTVDIINKIGKVIGVSDGYHLGVTVKFFKSISRGSRPFYSFHLDKDQVELCLTKLKLKKLLEE